MKKLLVLFCTSLLLIGCSSPKTIDDVEYRQYGLFNADERKNPKIDYQPSLADIVVGVVFCETIIVPVYIGGWDIMEPEGKKTNSSEANH